MSANNEIYKRYLELVLRYRPNAPLFVREVLGVSPYTWK